MGSVPRRVSARSGGRLAESRCERTGDWGVGCISESGTTRPRSRSSHRMRWPGSPTRSRPTDRSALVVSRPSRRTVGHAPARFAGSSSELGRRSMSAATGVLIRRGQRAGWASRHRNENCRRNLRPFGQSQGTGGWKVKGAKAPHIDLLEVILRQRQMAIQVGPSQAVAFVVQNRPDQALAPRRLQVCGARLRGAVPLFGDNREWSIIGGRMRSATSSSWELSMLSFRAWWQEEHLIDAGRVAPPVNDPEELGDSHSRARGAIG
jgi:hypothetical protein